MERLLHILLWLHMVSAKCQSPARTKTILYHTKHSLKQKIKCSQILHSLFTYLLIYYFALYSPKNAK